MCKGILDGGIIYTVAQKEAHLKELRAVFNNRSASQGELTTKIGISLGKASNSVQLLLDQSWINAMDFEIVTMKSVAAT